MQHIICFCTVCLGLSVLVVKVILGHFITNLFIMLGFKVTADINSKVLNQFQDPRAVACQILFSGKNKKNTINLSSGELAQRLL